MIYTDYWRLAFPPFSNDPRAGAFVPTHSAVLAVARLRYALGAGRCAAALFGDAGLGKTRVTKLVLDEFAAANWLTAYLPAPHGCARDILALLDRRATGVPAADASAGLGDLRRFLARETAGGRPILLAVDDVQTARGTDFLEMLRTLLNPDPADAPSLSLLLSGQPAMERKLEAASGFSGQLAVRAVLDPMSDEETKVYMLARLKAAGSEHGIFTRQAADRVSALSRGVPRQVSRLCEIALVIAYGLERDRVTPDVIDMAAADLDLLPGEDAPFRPWPHPRSEPEAEEAGAEEDILASIRADGE